MGEYIKVKRSKLFALAMHLFTIGFFLLVAKKPVWTGLVIWFVIYIWLLAGLLLYRIYQWDVSESEEESPSRRR